jgi:hypothetical protein
MIVIRQKAYSTEEENKYIKEGANSPSMVPVIAGIGGGTLVNSAAVATLLLEPSGEKRKMGEEVSNFLQDKFKKSGGEVERVISLFNDFDANDGALSHFNYNQSLPKDKSKRLQLGDALKSVAEKHKGWFAFDPNELKEELLTTAKNKSGNVLKGKDIDHFFNNDNMYSTDLRGNKVIASGTIKDAIDVIDGKRLSRIYVDKGKTRPAAFAHEMGHIHYYNNLNDEGKKSIGGLAHKHYKGAKVSKVGPLVGLVTGIKAGLSDKKENKLSEYSGALTSLASDAPMLVSEIGASVKGNKILNDAVKELNSGRKTKIKVSKLPFLSSAAGYLGYAAVNAGLSQAGHKVGYEAAKYFKDLKNKNSD